MAQYNVVKHTSIKKEVFRVYKTPIYSGFSPKRITTKKQNNLHNRQRSNSRAKRRIQELINLNFPQKFTFITLTFKENIEYPEIANTVFASFIKRLKYYFNHKKNMQLNLKYISVVETQKRGSIHYHMICNIPTHTTFTDIIALWQKSIENNKDILIKGGSARIRYSYEYDSNAEDLGFYLTKYLSKSFDNPKFCGKKLYSTSRNLKKPKRTNHMIKFENKNLKQEEVIKTLSKHFNLNTEQVLKTNKYLNPYTAEEVYYFEFKKESSTI